jgi:hypothetical protein
MGHQSIFMIKEKGGSLVYPGMSVKKAIYGIFH